MEEVVNPSKPLISECNSPPKSSSIVSSLAALENQMRMIDSALSANHSFGIKPLTNGFDDSCKITTKYSPSEKRPQNCSANASESSCSPRVSVSPGQSSSEGVTMKCPSVSSKRPEPQEPSAASVKREQCESPAQELRGVQASELCVKEETPYCMSFQLSRERGTFKLLHYLSINCHALLTFNVLF